ncbi:MAG: ribbon-helix-helix protein, CopG family [Gemmatimonadetes bacterium]|nr:ribbon-helix-helix protein, CopG family [Gemmatimonadota bacterium]
MKTLTVKVPDELDVKLGAVAAQRNESKSALIRAAIEGLVGADETSLSNAPPKGGEKEVSCLDLARDLSGCIEETEDLSYNKKYLRGYGL